MLNFVYNFLIINFFYIFLILKWNSVFLGFNKKSYIIFAIYHFLLTLTYIFIFSNADADYKTYLELKHAKPFDIYVFLTTTEFVYSIIYCLKNFLYLIDLNILFFFSIISFFGISIIVKNLMIIGVEKKNALYFFLIPGIHFWTSVPGKDSLILFFLAFFFYFYLNRKLLISCFFIILVLLIRPHIGVIFLLSLVVSEFFFIKGYKRLIVILVSLLFFYFIFTAGFSSGYFKNPDFVSENFFLQMINQLNSQLHKFETSSTYYESTNIYLNIFNYVIFPIKFIFKNNSLTINLSIMLEVYSFMLIIFLIIKQKSEIKLKKNVIIFLIMCTFFYLMLLPQVFFNYGLNVRQKWMIVPFLIYLSFFIKNLFLKINKK